MNRRAAFSIATDEYEVDIPRQIGCDFRRRLVPVAHGAPGYLGMRAASRGRDYVAFVPRHVDPPGRADRVHAVLGAHGEVGRQAEVFQHPGEKGNSHFPDGGDSEPRSAVVAIQREDGGVVGEPLSLPLS